MRNHLPKCRSWFDFQTNTVLVNPFQSVLARRCPFLQLQELFHVTLMIHPLSRLNHPCAPMCIPVRHRALRDQRLIESGQANLMMCYWLLNRGAVIIL